MTLTSTVLSDTSSQSYFYRMCSEVLSQNVDVILDIEGVFVHWQTPSDKPSIHLLVTAIVVHTVKNIPLRDGLISSNIEILMSATFGRFFFPERTPPRGTSRGTARQAEIWPSTLATRGTCFESYTRLANIGDATSVVHFQNCRPRTGKIQCNVVKISPRR